MAGRKWTPEQRKAASERFKARTAEPVAVAEPPAQEASVLDDLMAALQKAKDKRGAQGKVLEELGSVLDRIDPREYPDLADNPVIEQFLEKIGDARQKKAEKQGLPPGSVTGSGISERDVQWKLKDVNVRLDGSKELVTWTPYETIPIFYQGIMCQAIADVEMTTEKAFKDVYDERRRLLREAEQRKAYMFGKTNTPPPGEGTDGGGAVAAARVRAFIGMGGEGGGGRILSGYPGDAKFELRDVPGGGETSGETQQP